MRFLARSLLPIHFLAVFAAGNLVFGQSAWYEGFEGPEVSWREFRGDVRYKVLDHKRTGDAHTGQGCEWFRISAEGGTALYITHEVGHPRVIEELLPTVWIKSDRPGMSISANVVLPRMIDPRTNKPLVTAVLGETAYNDVGRWQQLRLADLSKLVARQVRALRMQLGPNVDDREAYLDAILLNIYGGPGATNVWIDDLDIAGYVNRTGSPLGQVVASLPRAGGTAPNNSPGAQPFAAPPMLPKRFDIKLSGSVLSVDGKPIFPRAIEHQGEPLSALKQLGFNAVWLKWLPNQELLQEADRLGLWLICPPPREDASLDPRGNVRSHRTGIRPRTDLGFGRRSDRRATANYAPPGRSASHRRPPLRAAAALQAAKRFTRLQPGGQQRHVAVGRSASAGNEHGTEGLRHVGQPAALGGPARHSDVDHRANAAQRSAADANGRDRSEHSLRRRAFLTSR